MISNLNIEKSKVSWKYKKNVIEIKKDKISDARYFEKENVVVILYEDEGDFYPCMSSYTLDGHANFIFKSADEFGITRFAIQKGINISVVGWIKEKGVYTDYNFSVDAENGSMERYSRAY